MNRVVLKAQNELDLSAKMYHRESTYFVFYDWLKKCGGWAIAMIFWVVKRKHSVRMGGMLF